MIWKTGQKSLKKTVFKKTHKGPKGKERRGCENE